jgi:hypothetical protein
MCCSGWASAAKGRAALEVVQEGRWVEASCVDAGGLPAGIEVAGVLLGGDEAPIEISRSAARGL